MMFLVVLEIGLVLILGNEWLKGSRLHAVDLYLLVEGVLGLVSHKLHFGDRIVLDAVVVVVVHAVSSEEEVGAVVPDDWSNMVKEVSENDCMQEDFDVPADSNNREGPDFLELSDAEDAVDVTAAEVEKAVMVFERSSRMRQFSVFSRLLRQDLPCLHTFVSNLHLCISNPELLVISKTFLRATETMLKSAPAHPRCAIIESARCFG